MTFDEIFDAACADLNLPRFTKTAKVRYLRLLKGGKGAAQTSGGQGFLRGINPWYMVPAIGAGAYGLSKVPEMLSGFSGGGGEMTAPLNPSRMPQEPPAPSGHRFRDLYRLAQASAQHGF